MPSTLHLYLSPYWALLRSHSCTVVQKMPPGRKLGQSSRILFCFPFLRDPIPPVSSIWKELFHTFCPIFWLFTAEGQVWYQILYHWQRFLLLFSCSVLSDSLQPHPSLSPRVDSNSCPLSQWCHPAIASSVVSFSSCPQPFPESGSFLASWLFA